MKKNILNISIIILVYSSSLILFVLVLGIGRIDRFIQECIKNGDEGNIGYFFVTTVEAGVLHFIIVLGIAIWAKFNKKLDNIIKQTLYFLPIFTYIFTIPAMFPAIILANWLGIIAK